MTIPFRSPIQTWQQTYLAPSGEEGLVVQQADPFEWEIDELTIRVPEGPFLCAEDGGGTILRANRPEAGDWETFQLHQVAVGFWTFQAWDGHFVRAVDTGEVLADAAQAGAWETYALAGTPQPVPPSEPPVPLDEHPHPLGGRLACNGRQFLVGGQPVLPVALHSGDAFSHAAHQGLDSLCQLVLDPAQEASYQIIRMWFSLDVKGRGGYWAGRSFGPWVQGWTLWRETIVGVLQACAARGLQVHLAGGDGEYMSSTERTQLYNEVGRTVAEVERDLGPVVALFEVLNECRNTGLADPQELTRLRDIFKVHNPLTLTALSSYSGTEETEELRPYTPQSQGFVYYHSTGDGTAGAWARHAFSATYEGRAPQVGKRLLWSGEPPGPGPRVSAISWQLQQDLLRGEALWLLAGAQTLGGVYTMFCSDGVIVDEVIDRWEGFLEIPRLVRQLEILVPNLHTARLTHVADYKPDRVVDLPNNDPNIRIDQYVLQGERVAVVVVYRTDAYDGSPTTVRLSSLVGQAEWRVLGYGREEAPVSAPWVAVTFRYGAFGVLRW